ncbi:guanylate kinase [Candidatus Symbiobacter mobilis]|nr:guanylate kinase [Candidatus Symbiobacter mobilis]
METSGNLFVVAAPSGAGKSSLVRALLAQDSRVHLSISHTTRPPRGQEVHGREYFFVSDDEFDVMVRDDAFLEWAHVHRYRYGTSKPAIADRIEQGEDVLLEIDYQGALQIRNLFAQAVLIFILPPSWEELRRRLENRGEDPPQRIQERLRNAMHEVGHARHFDFVIINGSFDQALSELGMVVQTQRLRYFSQRRSKPEVFQALALE